MPHVTQRLKETEPLGQKRKSSLGDVLVNTIKEQPSPEQKKIKDVHRLMTSKKSQTCPKENGRCDKLLTLNVNVKCQSTQAKISWPVNLPGISQM